jgi:uncharacterized radical SAM superfamily protein
VNENSNSVAGDSMIYKLQEYVDDENRRITQLTSEDNEVRFTGHVIMGIQTPQGTMERPIQFPISAKNIEEAFENFETSKETNAPKEAEKVIKVLKKQMEEQHLKRKNQIVVPGSRKNLPPQLKRFKG